MEQTQLNQLSSDLITLRNLQNQIQSGHHPIYNTNSPPHTQLHLNHTTLIKSSPPQSTIPSTSFPPNQTHPPSYHHQPQLLYQPIDSHYSHHLELTRHPTKPTTPHTQPLHSLPSNGTLDYYHQPIPQTRAHPTLKYPSPTQKPLDFSLPTDSTIPPPRHTPNPYPYQPHVTQRPSLDEITSPNHQPLRSRDPRLVHNRLPSQSNPHSLQTLPIHPPPPSNQLHRQDQHRHTDHTLEQIEERHHHQQPIKPFSSPRSSRRDEPRSDGNQLQSDHSQSRLSNNPKDRKYRHSRENDPDQALRMHHTTSEKNPARVGSSKLSREHCHESTSSEEKENDDEEEESVDLLELEADQKRYQEELERYHEELEIYQRKRKEREAAKTDRAGVLPNNSTTSDCGNKVSKRRRDSTDEYFKRSLETAGDPSNRNRRFSLASDRSTLLRSPPENQSPARDHSTKADPLGRSKFDGLSLNSEKETVEAATVLLGLGLSRATVSVNTTTTTTTTTSSTLFPRARDPALVIDDMLTASNELLPDACSTNQFNNSLVLPKLQSKKKSSTVGSSDDSKKKTPGSIFLKNQKPLSQHKSINHINLDRESHRYDLDKSNQLMMMNHNQNEQPSSNINDLKMKDLRKRQKNIRLKEADENLRHELRSNRVHQEEPKSHRGVYGGQQNGSLKLLDHLLVASNQIDMDHIQEEEDENQEEEKEHINTNHSEKSSTQHLEQNHVVHHVLRNRKIIKYSQ